MIIITGERGTGKTSELIKLSEETGYPIVARDFSNAKYIKDRAKAIGAKITDVYTVTQVENGKLRGIDYAGILLDDADSVIERALAYYLSATVKAVSVDNVVLLRSKDA